MPMRWQWGMWLWAYWMLVDGLLVTYTGSQSITEGSWFIMFHVVWCKYCTEVKPQFTAAAFSSTLKYLTIDCVKYNDLCHSFGVTSFPSFMYVEDGEKTLYEGHYYKQAFEDYSRKLQSPSIEHIAIEEWESKVSAHASAFTLAYNPSRDGPILSMFERTAERFKAQPMFFYAVPWDEAKVVSTTRERNDQYELTSLTERSMLEFVNLHKLPTLVEVFSDNFLVFKRSLKQKLLIVLAVDTHDLDATYRLSHFYSEAHYYRAARNARVQFCFLDTSSPDTELELLSLPSLPAVVALRLTGEIPLHRTLLDLTTQSVHEFVEAVVAGEVELTPLNPGVRHYVKSFQRWLGAEGSDIDFTGWVLLAAVLLICLTLLVYKRCAPRPKRE